ncbi:MAG: DNA polymerase III subunit epsilon [Chloroflexi bacterium 44-23]|nr:MAG: DNA polymerase III subunit epsilon [Chloroflexi bacterium 44-23]
MSNELYISVDVETAGPFPSQYALLSIGACLVSNTDINFYTELQPDRPDFLPESLKISGLQMQSLQQTGQPPLTAMTAFAEWVRTVTPRGDRPVFVALNAPFDWMFINDYFYRYIGSNPFGHSALDIKAFYMGYSGVEWSQTSFRHINRFLNHETCLAHNALKDAQDQAAIFLAILNQSRSFPRSS